MSSIVQKPDLRIVQTLTGLAAHHGKTYCIPSQKTILHLVRTHTGRVMSPRTLNRHLAALERDGWIQRLRRHKRGRTGALELHSTLYHLKRRALAWLAGTAKAAAQILRNWAHVVDSYAVPLTAENVNPSSQSLSGGVKTTPPPEFQRLKEALRAANPKAKPL